MGDVPGMCSTLQNGDNPDFGGCFSTTRSARSFFSLYLTDESLTCADEEQPPAALLHALAKVSPAVLDVILMNVVSSAVSPFERRSIRARHLVNALWDESWQLRTSCSALKAVVAGKLGDESKVVWDQSFEY